MGSHHSTSLRYPTPSSSISTPHSRSKSSPSSSTILVSSHSERQDFHGWPTSGKVPLRLAVDINHGHITHTRLIVATGTRTPTNPTPHPSPTNERRTDRAQDK
ncbi:hypothetical protein CF327_g1847 [Tilletia walkeri]|nr:hypothetical protein CF327_g1847 [Tilletia walkeri]